MLPPGSQRESVGGVRTHANPRQDSSVKCSVQKRMEIFVRVDGLDGLEDIVRESERREALRINF